MSANLLENVRDRSVRYVRPAWQLASVGTVNIRRDVDNDFYCYRLPLLNKIESKDNGMKIVVPNMFFELGIGVERMYVVATGHADFIWENLVFPTYFSPHLTWIFLCDSSHKEEHQASDVKDLAGFLKIEVSAADAWFEEDEPIYVHPKDP
ncbi:hypothetical protein F4604DRAFT_1925896 [Suillus subluteus]|nr:hypothetical protein F4604DRAFT_1925896 [Suillus subluteus]